METTRWEKLEAIYHSALAISADEREEFLRKICGDDAELLKDAKVLVQSNLPTAEFLKDNAFNLGVQVLAEKEKYMGNTIDDSSVNQ